MKGHLRVGRVAKCDVRDSRVDTFLYQGVCQGSDLELCFDHVGENVNPKTGDRVTGDEVMSHHCKSLDVVGARKGELCYYPENVAVV